MTKYDRKVLRMKTHEPDPSYLHEEVKGLDLHILLLFVSARASSQDLEKAESSVCLSLSAFQVSLGYQKHLLDLLVIRGCSLPQQVKIRLPDLV